MITLLKKIDIQTTTGKVTKYVNQVSFFSVEASLLFEQMDLGSV